MRGSAATPARVTLPGQLVVSVTSVSGGAGRSALSALLACGLTARITGQVSLLDTDAAGSPWPQWLTLDTTVPSDHSQTLALLGRPAPGLHAVPWPGHPDISVVGDFTGSLTPTGLDELLTRLACGDLPAEVSGSTAVVIDGPAAQATATRWARRTGHPGYLATQLRRPAPTFDPTQRRVRHLAVLVARGDMTSLAGCLSAVTDLEALGADTASLIIAVTCPAGGLARNVKARRELLRERVAAVITVPHQKTIATWGGRGYEQPRALAAAHDIIDAVLTLATPAAPATQPVGAALQPGAVEPAPVLWLRPTPPPAGHPVGAAAGDPFAVLSDLHTTL